MYHCEVFGFPLNILQYHELSVFKKKSLCFVFYQMFIINKRVNSLYKYLSTFIM